MSEIRLPSKEQQELLFQEAHQKADDRSATLERIVYEKSNPNPVYVMLFFISTLFIMWLLWASFLKPVLTGDWYDSHGNQWTIKHCPYRDVISVSVGGRALGQCSVLDNMVVCGEEIGIWDYRDTLVFLSGNTLQKINYM